MFDFLYFKTSNDFNVRSDKSQILLIAPLISSESVFIVFSELLFGDKYDVAVSFMMFTWIGQYSFRTL